MQGRIETIQSRTYEMHGIAMDALVALIADIQRARAAGATDAQLAPQEAARILVRSIDNSRRGQRRQLPHSMAAPLHRRPHHDRPVV